MLIQLLGVRLDAQLSRSAPESLFGRFCGSDAARWRGRDREDGREPADAQDEILGVCFCAALGRPGGDRHFFRVHVEPAERELDGASVLPGR